MVTAVCLKSFNRAWEAAFPVICRILACQHVAPCPVPFCCLLLEFVCHRAGDVRIMAIDISEAALARGRGRLSAPRLWRTAEYSWDMLGWFINIRKNMRHTEGFQMLSCFFHLQNRSLHENGT